MILHGSDHISGTQSDVGFLVHYRIFKKMKSSRYTAQPKVNSVNLWLYIKNFPHYASETELKILGKLEVSGQYSYYPRAVKHTHILNHTHSMLPYTIIHG